MKNKTYIGLIGIGVLLLCLTGCRPKGVLSSHEMRKVLVDLHKTDGAMQVAGLRGQDQEIKRIYYAQVLLKHGITQSQFDSSLVWYTAHPQLFNKIYPKVMADLESEENLLAEQLKENTQQKSVAPTLIHVAFDTTYFSLLEGYYPIARAIPHQEPDSLAQDSIALLPLMQDSVNQLLP